MRTQLVFPPDEHETARPPWHSAWRAHPRLLAVLGACVSALVLSAWLLVGPWGGSSHADQAPAHRTSALSALPSPTGTSPAPTPALSPVAIAADIWPGYMGGNARTGYNTAETALTAASVPQLQQMWRLHARGAIFSQPVVVNGLVYWGSWDGFEHATHITTGRDLWSVYLGKTVDAHCQPPSVGVSSTAFVAPISLRGVSTLVDYVGGADGRLYALNALTGAVIWRRSLGTPPATFLWSSPAVYDGSVYMGVSSFGDCPLIRGKVVKLDAATGAVQRVFYTVPAGCVGATVWGSIAINTATGLLYFTTGNEGACGVYESRAEAVVALRTADLSLAGSWQVPEKQRFFDADFGTTPVLFTASIQGATRDMLGVVNKNGLFYALDQAHISRGPVWSTRIADGGICPQCNGAGSIAPAAWDGTTILAAGSQVSVGGRTCMATLRGLDPTTGHPRWTTCLTAGAVFGAVMAIPGVALVGSGPTLVAISTRGANAGQVLYTFRDPQYAQTWFYSAANVSNGVVYVGNASGDLFALWLPPA